VRADPVGGDGPLDEVARLEAEWDEVLMQMRDRGRLQGPGPEDLDLGRGPQVQHGPEAGAEQQRHIRRGQVLQVVPPQQHSRAGGAAVDGRQASDVTDVAGSFELQPGHVQTLARPAG
jgi:hypothetical protein